MHELPRNSSDTKNSLNFQVIFRNSLCKFNLKNVCFLQNLLAHHLTKTYQSFSNQRKIQMSAIWREMTSTAIKREHVMMVSIQ